MGLDSYLFAAEIKNDLVAEKTISDIISSEAAYEVAYWRKFNALHRWFVENVQNGVDDCGDYPVSREALMKLLEVLEQVQKFPDLREKLLPTVSGFFFGSTDYDEWYESQVDYSVNQLRTVLSRTEPDTTKFYYLSSW